MRPGDVVRWRYRGQHIYGVLTRFKRVRWDAEFLTCRDAKPAWQGEWDCHPETLTFIPPDDWPDEVCQAMALRALKID
jgi:hypothetical protein